MHTTDQLNTALEGKYAIERRVGAGGMAVVYLARDLRHNRRVALKVLNPELGAVLGSERFMAEIQVTANLHHPNLLPLFDSGEAGGLLFYAMPFVEGETLRQRLQRERQLGVDEAVRLAVALAGALDYAHRHNVIHRDLKPENILLHEGQPLVMDFGIALAVSKAGGTRITQTGLSLGTPQYMSPEQATGDHSLDARSDIYSLGAVLYEMLIGDPPHTGSTVQAVIAKVITEQPSSVRATRPTVPEHVEAALMMALAKLPADRFATAADFAAALSGSRAVGLSTSAIKASVSSRRVGSGEQVARARRREIAAWTLAVAGVATAATVFFWPRPRAPEASTVGRFAIQLPESVEVTLDAQGARMAVSRDGSRIAVVGVKGRETSIYLWSSDNPVSQSVRGTEGATTVTFSPNGEALLFSVGVFRLLRVPIGGGTPSTVVTIPTRSDGQRLTADNAAIRTASWGDGDRVVFTRGGELWMTTPEGTTPHRLASPDTAHGISALGHPEIVPGGTHALIELRSPINDSISLGVVSLSDGSIKNLGIHGVGPHYAEPGYLVYGQTDNVVYAAPFSLRRHAITGPAARVLDDVFSGAGAAPDIAIAQNGWMVVRTGGGEMVTQLVVVDRAGKERPLNSNLPPKGYNDPSISPDGKHIVVRAGSRITGGRGVSDGDLWLYDVESGALSMFAANAGYRPKWTRDGSRIVYLNGVGAATRVLSRPWDGSGADSVVVARPSIAEIEPGPKAGYSAIRTQSGADIFIGPTDSLSALRPFIEGPARETNPAISPDGKWLVYMSDETKQPEIYARPLPGPGARVTISVGGGTQPRWSRDGSTIFYRGPTQIMAGMVTAGATLNVVKREALFTDNNRAADGDGGRWDVFPNGREFLFAKAAHRQETSTLYVLVNWQRLLGRMALQKATP